MFSTILSQYWCQRKWRVGTICYWHFPIVRINLVNLFEPYINLISNRNNFRFRWFSPMPKFYTHTLEISLPSRAHQSHRLLSHLEVIHFDDGRIIADIGATGTRRRCGLISSAARGTITIGMECVCLCVWMLCGKLIYNYLYPALWRMQRYFFLLIRSIVCHTWRSEISTGLCRVHTVEQ